MREYQAVNEDTREALCIAFALLLCYTHFNNSICYSAIDLFTIFLQYASRVCSECFYKAISRKTRSFIAGQFTLQNSTY